VSPTAHLEQIARDAIRLDEPAALIDRFGTLVRESGTADERAGGAFIVERLQALGIPVELHTPELYLSNPERAELRLLAAADGGALAVRCRPPAFALHTNGEEVVGELCYVPSQYAGGTADLFDLPKAAAEGQGDDPVRGRIVLTEGFSMPASVSSFEKRGAIAQIFIHPGQDIHEGICTPIWGTPTPESLGRKPKVPVVCVNHPDGDRLIALTRQGRVRVGVKTWLREGWMRCPLPVVTIPGTEDPDEFLLVHGHHDSWYEGIGDNATGDAALLELARVLWGLRGELKRSVRIAWWPGHSTGRYAGSTWYADTFADEIDEWCIAHLNIDSPGCAGATAYEEVMWMAEAGALCSASIHDALGVRAVGMRPLRAGDYSFNQIGPTAFYMLLSNIPQAERTARGYYAVGGCGGRPVWHTPHDVRGVEDLEILRRDLAVYLTTIVRVVNAPLYPFDYAAAVDEIRAAVERYQSAAGGELDLGPVLDDLAALRADIVAWRAEAEQQMARAPHDAAWRRHANATLRRLARVLVPLNYARGERFDHDPAMKLPPVPRFEAATAIAATPPERRGFVRTALLRERNKVRAMLRGARQALQAGRPGAYGVGSSNT
jgi:N-acetylated-alpha-linked acidic dipeptidase